MNLLLLPALLCAHAVCDYPLQGDFLARGKNHKAPIPGVSWIQCMAAHSAIHAAAVWFLTGSAALGLAEFACHFIIDMSKCDGIFGFNTDQALHVVCKVWWVLFVMWGIS